MRIYLVYSDQLSTSTRWQNGHYPVNPDGAGANRIHALRIKVAATWYLHVNNISHELNKLKRQATTCKQLELRLHYGLYFVGQIVQ